MSSQTGPQEFVWNSTQLFLGPSQLPHDLLRGHFSRKDLLLLHLKPHASQAPHDPGHWHLSVSPLPTQHHRRIPQGLRVQDQPRHRALGGQVLWLLASKEEAAPRPHQVPKPLEESQLEVRGKEVDCSEEVVCDNHVEDAILQEASITPVPHQDLVPGRVQEFAHLVNYRVAHALAGGHRDNGLRRTCRKPGQGVRASPCIKNVAPLARQKPLKPEEDSVLGLGWVWATATAGNCSSRRGATHASSPDWATSVEAAPSCQIATAGKASRSPRRRRGLQGPSHLGLLRDNGNDAEPSGEPDCPAQRTPRTWPTRSFTVGSPSLWLRLSRSSPHGTRHTN
mmetsp:Transcript_63403/g.138058  ORF Transcript_63403/g.138058 Transcript_63403/m.138058 type:complete len:338 (+) Transcript_63403:125-1138(+)